jgi:hypothetical protein
MAASMTCNARTLVIALGVATLAVGVMHAPFARPLLGKLHVSVCPVKNASATAVNDMHQRGLGKLRGDKPTAITPALGLALGTTRIADAQAWAAKNGVACRAETRGLSYLHCTSVHALDDADAPPIADLVLTFHPSGTLMSVDGMRVALPGARAVELMTRIGGDLDARLGPPTNAAGENTADYLTSGALHTRVVDYRFSNYIAKLTATNFPARGVIVREEYSLIQL